MNIIRVVRKEETEKATLGEMYLDGNFLAYTLEPVWDGNQTGSCIPPGKYIAYIRDHKQSKSRWSYNPIQLIDVFKRDYIQIHIGNYPDDTEGCILVGKGRGKNAIWRSRDAYNELMNKMDKTKEIKIIVEYKN